jgi:hypothetical protein
MKFVVAFCSSLTRPVSEEGLLTNYPMKGRGIRRNIPAKPADMTI